VINGIEDASIMLTGRGKIDHPRRGGRPAPRTWWDPALSAVDVNDSEQCRRVNRSVCDASRMTSGLPRFALAMQVAPLRMSIISIQPEALPYVVEREVDVFHLAGAICVSLAPFELCQCRKRDPVPG
jgi:hypothetical protein